MTEAPRSETLALAAPRFWEILASVRARYLDGNWPLDETRQSLADLRGALLDEWAESHRLLMQKPRLARFRLFREDPLPAHVLQRLFCLRHLLLHHYEIHAAVPPGLWLDLHQTYAYARRIRHVDDRSDGAQSETSTDVYRSVLLLASADPYRLSHQELQWTLDLISEQGMLAQLTPAASPCLRPGVFAVDTQADAPPYPLARDQDPLLQAWSHTLNTTELVKFLTWLLNQLDTHALPDAEPDAAWCDPRYPAFLQRLIRQWGASRQRLTKRRPVQDLVLHEVVIGFAALCEDLARQAPATRQDAIFRPTASHITTCQVENLSAGGLTLYKTGDLPPALKVGELLGVRPPGGPHWQAGIVRWVRAPQRGEVVVGVQLLAPFVHATRLFVRSATPGAPALFLSTQRDRTDAGLLITLPGTLPAGERASILLGTMPTAVRIERRLEIAPDLEACRIRVCA